MHTHTHTHICARTHTLARPQVREELGLIPGLTDLQEEQRTEDNMFRCVCLCALGSPAVTRATATAGGERGPLQARGAEDNMLRCVRLGLPGCNVCVTARREQKLVTWSLLLPAAALYNVEPSAACCCPL